MPRNRGIGAKRKAKKPPPQKPEAPETILDPAAASGEPASKPSSSSCPAEAGVNDEPEKENVGQAIDDPQQVLDKAVSAAIMSSSDFTHAENVYNYELTRIAARTRTRGATLAKEASMQAEIDFLKAKLANTECLLEASQAQEAVYENIIEMNQQLADKISAQLSKANKLLLWQKDAHSGTKLELQRALQAPSLVVWGGRGRGLSRAVVNFA